MAVPVAVPLAGRAVGLDDDVTELGPAAIEPRRRARCPPPTPVPSVSITRFDAPFPAPSFHSASVAAFASFSTPTGSPNRDRARAPTRSKSSSGRFVARRIRPRAALEVRRHAEPERHDAVVEQLPRPHASSAARTSCSESLGALALVPCEDRPVAVDDAREDLRPADVDSDDERSAHGAGYHSAPDGRGRQALPAVPRRPGQGQGPPRQSQARAPREPASTPGDARGERRWGRWVALGARRARALLPRLGRPRLPLVLERGGARRTSAFRDARRTSSRQRTGRCSPTPATILVIGTDGGKAPGRTDARRSDSLLLLRTDPSTAPARRTSRSRATSASTSPATARRRSTPRTRSAARRSRSRTVRDAHRPADPPRRRRRLRRLQGADRRARRRRDRRAEADPLEQVRLPVQAGALPHAGTGGASRRASSTWTAVARSSTRAIRTNQLDPSDTDVTRGGRQQAVADAVGDKIASFGTFLRLPFIGDSLAAPLATDLSAWELDAARLGALPRGLEPLAALPPRRRARLVRRRVRDPRVGGQRRGDRDVPPAARRRWRRRRALAPYGAGLLRRASPATLGLARRSRTFARSAGCPLGRVVLRPIVHGRSPSTLRASRLAPSSRRRRRLRRLARPSRRSPSFSCGLRAPRP